MVMANQYQKEHHPCVIKQGVLLCGSTLCCCCRLKLTDTLTRLVCVQDQDAFKAYVAADTMWSAGFQLRRRSLFLPQRNLHAAVT